MSHLVSRILLAIFLFPLAAIFYVIIWVVGMEYREDVPVLMVANMATWIAVAIYWWLLWRSSVAWTVRRVGISLSSIVAAAGTGTVVGFLAADVPARYGTNTSFGVFVGGVLAMLLWLVATVFIWRETRLERASRISGTVKAITCPSCGYNLTGLSEARCPECGAKYTLDELLAGQPEMGTEIE